jgi:hypothetical protein
MATGQHGKMLAQEQAAAILVCSLDGLRTVPYDNLGSTGPPVPKVGLAGTGLPLGEVPVA